jgi:hypothetical protein
MPQALRYRWAPFSFPSCTYWVQVHSFPKVELRGRERPVGTCQSVSPAPS